MKPILAIVLFALVCISHRIEFTNAELSPHPLFNLERLNLVKRQSANRVFDVDSEDDDSSSSPESNESSKSSTGVDPAASGPSMRSDPDTAEAMDESQGSQSSQGVSTAPPSMTSDSNAEAPCDDSESSTSPPTGGESPPKNPGLIGRVENGVHSLTTNVIDGVMGIEHTVTKAITDMIVGVENAISGMINAIVSVIKFFADTMMNIALAPFRFLLRNVCLILGCTEEKLVNSLQPSFGVVSLAKRSIRSTTDLSHQVMVSPYYTLMQAIEMLVEHLARIPPKEREWIVQILKDAQCRFSEWYGFGSCTDVAGKPDLNHPISWQVALENMLRWTKNHLKIPVAYGLMSEDRANAISRLCQVLLTILGIMNEVEGF